MAVTTVRIARPHHYAYVHHMNHCRRGCENGGLCWIGKGLLTNADAEGWRIEHKQQRIDEVGTRGAER